MKKGDRILLTIIINSLVRYERKWFAVTSTRARHFDENESAESISFPLEKNYRSFTSVTFWLIMWTSRKKGWTRVPVKRIRAEHRTISNKVINYSFIRINAFNKYAPRSDRLQVWDDERRLRGVYRAWANFARRRRWKRRFVYCTWIRGRRARWRRDSRRSATSATMTTA